MIIPCYVGYQYYIGTRRHSEISAKMREGLLTKYGMNIYEIDLTPWREKVEEIYSELEKISKTYQEPLNMQISIKNNYKNKIFYRKKCVTCFLHVD